MTNARDLTLGACDQHCQKYPQGLRGFSYNTVYCLCHYDDGYAPGSTLTNEQCPDDRQCYTYQEGAGEIKDVFDTPTASCWMYTSFVTEATGDPHCK